MRFAPFLIVSILLLGLNPREPMTEVPARWHPSWTTT